MGNLNIKKCSNLIKDTIYNLYNPETLSCIKKETKSF